MSLRPCPTCQRHVTASEPTCPFCGARARPDFRLRVGGLLVVSAIGLLGCMQPPQAMPVYGAPAPPMTSPSPTPTP